MTRQDYIIDLISRGCSVNCRYDEFGITCRIEDYNSGQYSELTSNTKDEVEIIRELYNHITQKEDDVIDVQAKLFS